MISRATLAARAMLNTFGIEDTSQSLIEDFIIYHDGIVEHKILPGCDGRMVMKNGRSIVSVSSEIEFPHKIRFVLAHELGHIILHAENEVTFSDDYSTLEAYKHGPQEVEANDFATELLMPENLFKNACVGKKFSSQLIRELSERFNTSITSTVYRFVELGNHPICVFFSKDGKIQYPKRSKDFWLKVPDRNKLQVPSDSVANEYYSKNRIYRKEDADQQIDKSTWFELGEHDRDTPMYEFCVITKRYNSVLSVIWEK